jgi:hypothetical protein
MPSKTPDMITASSGSFRRVLAADIPGRLRLSIDWMIPSFKGILGGQPSMTTPIPFPCDSPQVVILNNFPKVFPGMIVSLMSAMPEDRYA